PRIQLFGSGFGQNGSTCICGTVGVDRAGPCAVTVAAPATTQANSAPLSIDTNLIDVTSTNLEKMRIGSSRRVTLKASTPNSHNPTPNRQVGNWELAFLGVELLRARRLHRIITHRSLHRAMRELLPLAVPLRIHALEPDVHVGGIAGGRLRKIEVAAERDRHIAVKLHLLMIELAVDIRQRLPLHVLDPARLGIDLE